MTVSPPRKNASSVIPHSASKGTLSTSASPPFILSEINQKEVYSTLGDPPRKGSTEPEEFVFCLDMSFRDEERLGRILFRGLKVRPSAGFRRTALGLQGSEPNTDQGFEGWPLGRAPKAPQSTNSGMTMGMSLHSRSSGCDSRYLKTYSRPPRAIVTVSHRRDSSSPRTPSNGFGTKRITRWYLLGRVSGPLADSDQKELRPRSDYPITI
jgi:hypothetical protein